MDLLKLPQETVVQEEVTVISFERTIDILDPKVTWASSST